MDRVIHHRWREVRHIAIEPVAVDVTAGVRLGMLLGCVKSEIVRCTARRGPNVVVSPGAGASIHLTCPQRDRRSSLGLTWILSPQFPDECWRME